MVDSYTFNVDFDGTVVTHEYPFVGRDIGAVPVLKRIVRNGHKLILFTMRSGFTLDDAVEWFKTNEIPLYGIQTNPTQNSWTTSPKSLADIMIDDSAIGCPLAYNSNISTRGFVNWVAIEKMLEEQGLLEIK